MKRSAKIILMALLAIIVVLTSLKIYIIISETSFHDLNVNNLDRIKHNMENRTQFSFVVIGNVRNSIDVFDKKIIPLINDENADFAVFPGDFLLNGGQDKYGAFYKTQKKIKIPVITAIGDNEVSDNGADRFYRHFGPYYFSYSLGDSYFIFPDTTGQTSEEWEKEWLTEELEKARDYSSRFIVMNRPLEEQYNENLTFYDTKQRINENYSVFLEELFSEYNVTAVFSSNTEGFNEMKINGVEYISTGGGGGIVLSKSQPDYHIIKVTVSQDKTSYEVIRLNDSGSSFIRFWKPYWFHLHSWFYISYINFVLSILLVSFFLYLIYSKLIETPDYYPKYDIKNIKKKKLIIAMFTNNYLPFIGGVPISISRLKKGLEKLGHTVYVFAPGYPGKSHEKNIIRCSTLFNYRKGDIKVPITNIFSLKIRKEFRRIKPNIVHVHHPYWLGPVGRRLAKKSRIPVIYTYHTRLEQYNHYSPFFRKLAGGRIPHMIIRRFANSCNAIISPTISTKEYLRNLGVGKVIKVIPTGVDMDSFEMNKARKRRIGILNKRLRKNREIILFSVFRLSKEKNPYFLLEGIKRIKESTKIPFRCLIAGTGPEEKNMRKFIEKNGLGSTVTLLGKVRPEDIPDYYMMSDIFVFSSKSETQGIVLLEAMAGSCPVVAIQSSGTHDFVINNRNGFKTKDDIDEWSGRIIYLMENKKVLKDMSKKARNFSMKYTTISIGREALNLYYQTILKNRP